MSLLDKVKHYTKGLDDKGLLRTRVVSRFDEPNLIRFDSNDYLSLNQNPVIAAAFQEGFKSFVSGSGSSMLLSGYHENHRNVERAFADFLSVDDCILFSSGYAANLAVTALLGQLKVKCMIDKGVHASIYDGLNQARILYDRYLHNNLDDLQKKLQDHSVLLCEGIYSMSGQMSPLNAISTLCANKGMVLCVDEAHSFGVMGCNGRGAVNSHQLTQNEVPLRTIAFGKAFAFQGALVAGQKDWINGLLQAGRSLIYSTAISPALCHGLLKTLDVVHAEDDRRFKLQELISQFRASILESSLQWSDSLTAIQQLQLGCPQLAMHYANALQNKGIYCSSIRAPTVAAKETGLRIILNYRHDVTQIKRLFNELDKIYEHQHK